MKREKYITKNSNASIFSYNLQQTNNDYWIAYNPGEFDELEHNSSLLDWALRRSNELEKKLQESYNRIAELEDLSMTDELTSVLNRRGFTRDLKRAFARAKRHGEVSVLCLIDIDDFKYINDHFGHLIGDKTLQFVAQEIANNIRQTDSIGRVAGDEFMILFTNTNIINAMEKVRAIQNIIEKQKLTFGRDQFNVKISLGVDQLTSDATEKELLNSVDQLMYKDKKKKSVLYTL